MFGKMRKFEVWYARRPDFTEKRSANGFRFTHTCLGVFEATDLEDLFSRMQAERWSPNGEARDLISSKGLKHTSMSVGDLAIIPGYSGDIFEVGEMGWNSLGSIDRPKVSVEDAHMCPHCGHLFESMNPEKGSKKSCGEIRITCPECGGEYYYLAE